MKSYFKACGLPWLYPWSYNTSLDYSKLNIDTLSCNVLVFHSGFSTSFPLDGSLFDSWLAQSVQITADNVLSKWAMAGEPRDPSASLLSDQLLQGEESLLNLMMDHSMKSTWKTPQLGRKTRGKSRGRSHKLNASGTGVSACSTPKGKSSVEIWGTHGSRRGERQHSLKTLHHHHHHYYLNHAQTSTTDGKADLIQPPISKMDSCHISEKNELWESSGDAGVTSASSAPGSPTAPEMESRRSSQVALRVRLPRQGKSRFKSGGLESSGEKETLLLDSETDSYFSNAEQSDLRRTSRKLHLTPIHTGKEDVLRQSILAS